VPIKPIAIDGNRSKRPLGVEKLIIFRLINYSDSSTNPENLAKIGRVDVKIIGLTEIVKR